MKKSASGFKNNSINTKISSASAKINNPKPNSIKQISVTKTSIVKENPPHQRVISTSKSTQHILPQNAHFKNSDKAVSQNKKIYLNNSQKDLIMDKRINSALNFTGGNGMTRVNSLKPFPKVDPEFYSDNQDYFWNKDLQRVHTELNIFSKSQSSRKFLNVQLNLFNKSDIFSKENKNTSNYVEGPSMTKSISSSRIRDYHKEGQVLPQTEIKQKVYDSYNLKFNNKSRNSEVVEVKPTETHKKKFNGVKTVTIDFKLEAGKSLTPMHLKLYESSMQTSKFIKKTQLPGSHPSFEKFDDKYNPITTPTFKKKVDFHKTTYNFLKNFY